jgi:plastocyanin
MAKKTVSIRNHAYDPNPVEIHVGDTVEWTNYDGGQPHTVTSDAGSELDSGDLAKNDKFEHTFKGEPRTEKYHCENHPVMKASVVIKA